MSGIAFAPLASRTTVSGNTAAATGLSSPSLPDPKTPPSVVPGSKTSAAPTGSLGYRIAGNPSFTDTTASLAQAGWEETTALFFPLEVLGDFIKSAAQNPARLWSIPGGIVGGMQTIGDMAKGLLDLTLQGAEVLAVPEEKIPQLLDQAGKACNSLGRHGSEVPAKVVASLRAEINDIAALYNKGDAVSLWNAGRKSGHLASSVFAAVEGGAGGGKALLTKGGAALSKARTTESAIVATLRDLQPAQTPNAVKLADHLANNPQIAARVPKDVIKALHWPAAQRRPAGRDKRLAPARRDAPPRPDPPGRCRPTRCPDPEANRPRCSRRLGARATLRSRTHSEHRLRQTIAPATSLRFAKPRPTESKA
jgi:hypothetical protein